MADTEVENCLGFIDRRRESHGQDAGTVAASGGMPFAAQSTDDSSYFVSVAGLINGLVAVNPTYYTTARLNQMTKNDMLYALRVHYDPAGI